MKQLIKKVPRFLRTLPVLLVCAGTVLWGETLWAGGVRASGDQPTAGTSANPAAASAAGDNAHYPVTITNYSYAKEPVPMVFTQAPERVVAVYQNSIETLLALGLEDRIIAAAGLDHEVKPEFAAAFAKVAYLSEFTPSRERVIMLQPDFILSWYSLFNESRLGEVDYWHSRGTNTFIAANSGVLATSSLENEYQDILSIGTIFNVTEKAQVLVNEMRAEVERVAAYAQGSTQKRVLIMETQSNGLRIYGRNALGGDMAAKLGADVILESGVISAEALIDHNPDCIFMVYFGSSADKQTADAAVEQITGNPAYASLAAVKNARVFPIPLGEMYCSGIRTLDGIITLAKGMYPELYR
ncbi:MAG: ABC transporter substrate-binding protein [Treponema sp.]|jgi:iron complex transport system substrate-binding protein|nr:ABC transporter substrate-binding protein [Treponema sp.]